MVSVRMIEGKMALSSSRESRASRLGVKSSVSAGYLGGFYRCTFLYEVGVGDADLGVISLKGPPQAQGLGAIIHGNAKNESGAGPSRANLNQTQRKKPEGPLEGSSKASWKTCLEISTYISSLTP